MNILGKNRKKNKNQRKKPDKPIKSKKLAISMALMFIAFFLLIIRIGWIQFVDGANLKELASRQQTLNRIISPTRGAIYDTNGKALAISAKVDTITINPAKFIIKDKERRNYSVSRKNCQRIIRNF